MRDGGLEVAQQLVRDRCLCAALENTRRGPGFVGGDHGGDGEGLFLSTVARQQVVR